MTATHTTLGKIQEVKARRLSVLRYLDARAAGCTSHLTAGTVARQGAPRRLAPTNASVLHTGTPRDDFTAREVQRIIAAASR